MARRSAGINGSLCRRRPIVVNVFYTIAAMVLCTAPGFAAGPPNIVVILADDLGIESIDAGRYWPNGTDVITPNLAQLASQGRVFSQARVNPKCSPTRAGVLTGRIGLRTGVVGYQVGGSKDKALLALQGEEITIAEVLRAAGYQTFFIGKWHVGDDGNNAQTPVQQGFEIAEQYGGYLYLDDPIEVGDEHVTFMVDLAVSTVNERASHDRPYSLFFWHLDPHARIDDTGREPLQWWRVDEALLPSGEPYYHVNREDDTAIDRYRAVVEAYDTELRRLLFEIGVIDQNGMYRPESNTVVFFMGDNGENDQISPWGERSKGTVYECGIRVPCFVFGEGVPADGLDSSRRVMQTDLYDTICDIAGIPVEMRGSNLRDSMSFADAIGWSGPLLERAYQILNQEDKQRSNDPYDQRVALVGAKCKLICRAGGTGLAPLDTDEFYDLRVDPHENSNLVVTGMRPGQYAEYLAMRDAIVDYWFTSVCEPTEQMIDIPMTHAKSLVNRDYQFNNDIYVGCAFIGGNKKAAEARGLYRFDIQALDALLPPDKTLNDVASAQIVVMFGSDSGRSDETDTDVIKAFPVTTDWFSKPRSWAQMLNAYKPIELGQVDLAPHIIWNPIDPRLSGVPMPPGTPVSLGHAANLLDAVRFWYAYPDHNYGVVLIARQNKSLGGDQHVVLQPNAFLRLTLKPG